MRRYLILGLLVLAFTPLICPAARVRIKDVARVEFERENPLLGYGLVVGLNGTGDDTSRKEVAQAIQSYLALVSGTPGDMRMNPAMIQAKNSALVVITAELPPYARAGSRLDVTINSQFDASSLQGGTLLPTPLYGLDGKVYAVSQGPVALGGYSQQEGGAGGSQKNHPTVGTITDGAIVESNANYLRNFDRQRLNSGMVNLILKNPDFSEARNIQRAINESFQLSRSAMALDPGTVQVDLRVIMQRYQYDTPMELIAEIEQLTMETDTPARVIVSERTGVVIAGAEAKLSAVDIVHGDLRIVIRPDEPDQIIQEELEGEISETGGNVRPVAERVIPGRRGEMEITETDATLVQLKEGDTVGNLIQAISGPLAQKSPRDIISVLQALDRMGVLHAKLMFVGD